MDCDKIAKIYLRSCYAEKSGFYIETFTEQYLREIANSNNNKVCLEAMKLFDTACQGKEDKLQINKEDK